MEGSVLKPSLLCTSILLYLALVCLPASWAALDAGGSTTAVDGGSHSERGTDGFAAARGRRLSAKAATNSTAFSECNSTSASPLPPQGAYRFVFTSREALQELGVSLDSSDGRLVKPVFKNSVSVPPVTEGLENSKVKVEENRLKTKGFSLASPAYISLAPFQMLQAPVVCGACKGPGYFFVRVDSIRKASNGGTVYEFVGVAHPSGKELGIAVSVFASSLVILGTSAVAKGSMASLICTGPGQAPLLLPDPLSSADEAPSYRSGPFKEKVEVAHAEVLQGPSPKDSILKARLVFHNGASAVEHVLPESLSGLFFGKLAGPPLAEGAYVVSSLRANPQCTLERQEESGPVVLSCNAWDELKQRLGSRVSADRHRKRMRRSVLIAGAVIGGLALASGGVLYAGWHKRDLSKAKLARENGNFSRLFSQLIEKQGVEVEFWPEFFDSLNPANVIQAGNNVLGRNKFMEVPRDQHGDIRSGSLTHLMRGGGMYGIAAAQTLGALTLYTFLAERSVRNRIQRHNESMIKKNLRKGMRNVCKPASSCVSSSGGLGTSKETIVFLVI